MTERTFPESKMFAPVRDWLTAQGYRVFAEAWGHDVVGIRGEHIIVVELKTSFTLGLWHQLYGAVTYADLVYAGVGTQPRAASRERCVKAGFGLLIVSDAVHVAVEPTQRTEHFAAYRTRKLEALQRWEPNDRIGGLPNLAGDGDAQRVSRAVAQYREANPGAKWKDIFRDVPNHYAHAASMRQGMASTVKREAWKAKRKALAALGAAGAKGER